MGKLPARQQSQQNGSPTPSSHQPTSYPVLTLVESRLLYEPSVEPLGATGSKSCSTPSPCGFTVPTSGTYVLVGDSVGLGEDRAGGAKAIAPA